MIAELIDKVDNFEAVRDQIAAILALETVSQQAKAAAAGKDPKQWKLRVYTERSNPWEALLNGPPTDKSPLVNVWYDESTFSGNTVDRQKSETIFNIDCYGYGMSKDTPGGGHKAGDQEAALETHRALRLVRNIIMAGTYTYLGLRGLVWQRWPQSVKVFQPEIEGRAVQQVVGGRLVLRVGFNEFSPQAPAGTLEYLSMQVTRAEDGEVILRAEYDYTTP